MRHFIALVLITAFTLAFAQDSEITPYENTYKCSAGIIHVKGMRCESDDTCPTVSLTQVENAELITSIGKKFPIRPLAQSFPKSKRILRDEGLATNPQTRIYGIESVTCLSKDKIGVLYFGGGNCRSGCENYVTYTVSEDRGIIDAHLAE